MTDAERHVQVQLFFDPTCELCQRFADWVRARDAGNRVAVWPLDEPGLEERFPGLDLERAQQQLTVRDDCGELYEGLAALRQLGRRLPGLARLDWIYGLPGVRQVAAGMYGMVNRYRRSLCVRCGHHWRSSRWRGRRGHR